MICFVLCIVLPYSLLSQRLLPELNFITSQSIPFYDNKVSSLQMEIINNLGGYSEHLFKKISDNSLVANIKKVKENVFEIFFYEPIDVNKFKVFIEYLGLKYFFINNNKIYTEDLLSKEEIEKKKNNIIDSYSYTSEINNPNSIEYYNFNIYNIDAKLQSLYSNNYPYHLLNGNVAKLRERKEYFLNERSKFLNNKN